MIFSLIFRIFFKREHMKLLITGSRGANSESDYKRLKEAIEKYAPETSLILHGGAIGADQLAQRFAEEKGLATKVIRPDYRKHHPKVAPIIRNTLLVDAADKVIALYKSSKKGGTLDTAKKAAKQEKLLLEILEDQIQSPALQLGLW